jgi:NAD/NADP transhydrogenase alpha subunit
VRASAYVHRHAGVMTAGARRRRAALSTAGFIVVLVLGISVLVGVVVTARQQGAEEAAFHECMRSLGIDPMERGSITGYAHRAAEAAVICRGR